MKNVIIRNTILTFHFLLFHSHSSLHSVLFLRTLLPGVLDFLKGIGRDINYKMQGNKVNQV